MDKKLLTIILSVFLMVTLVGCASQRVWTYRAEPYVKTEPLVNKKVAVIPLVDKRQNINENRTGLGYIPLFPYGWQDFYTPEGAQMHITSGLWMFKPAEDFSKAIAEEVQNAGIFKEAFFTYKASEGEYVLRGEIKSTRYEGKLYTYCISFAGVYLWFLGLPAGSAQNTLEISLHLEDLASGQILWEGSYTKNDGSTSWIYAMQPDFFYDSLLKDIMKEVIPSLKQKFANYKQ